MSEYTYPMALTGYAAVLFGVGLWLTRHKREVTSARGEPRPEAPTSPAERRDPAAPADRRHAVAGHSVAG
jgi:hypothetical protein